MADSLGSGQSLAPGGRLDSQDARSSLVMQTDGNLVLYRQRNVARWSSGTNGRPVRSLDMQTDGNLVIYDPARRPTWASGTNNHPGSVLVLQNDGNLVVYSGSGPSRFALWATGTNIINRRVAGFLPSQNGFHFSNSNFPRVPDYRINVLGQTISLGDASNGLCGGMSYAVRDLFQSRQLPPSITTTPGSGAVFDFIARRLLDSFELPGGPVKYMGFMNPALADHETDFSRAGLAPHGRSWTMLHDEWPRIRAELDAGHLVNLALVQIKSFNPGDLGHNHQVLVWGYDFDNNDVNIRLYDPNFPDDDNVCLSLNVSDPQHSVAVRHNRSADTVNCFFRTGYSFVVPPR